MAVPVSRLERLEDELVYGKLLSVSDSVSDSESGSDNTWIRSTRCRSDGDQRRARELM
jgi:hypothetical protein